MVNGFSPVPLREVNDRAYAMLRRSGAEGGNFVCECGKKDCHKRVELLVIEYAARYDEVLLAPGHKLIAPVAAVRN